MASSPKVIVRMPKSLETTPSERAELKRTFNTSVVSVLKKHGSVGNDITNVQPTIVEIVEVSGIASSRTGPKAKTGRKASKKKTASKKK